MVTNTKHELLSRSAAQFKKRLHIVDVMSGRKTKKHGVKYICVVYIIKVLQWRLEKNGM